MSTLLFFFGWPTGAVWSNLIASLIWSAPAWGLVLYRQSKNHRELKRSIRELHDKHNDIMEAIKKGGDS